MSQRHGQARTARQQYVREELERYLMASAGDEGDDADTTAEMSLQRVAARVASHPRATAAVWARYADEWWYRPDVEDAAWREIETLVDRITG
jgi:hypothetical protein